MWLSVMLARLVFGLLDLVFHFYVVCSCLYISPSYGLPPFFFQIGEPNFLFVAGELCITMNAARRNESNLINKKADKLCN